MIHEDYGRRVTIDHWFDRMEGYTTTYLATPPAPWCGLLTVWGLSLKWPLEFSRFEGRSKNAKAWCRLTVKQDVLWQAEWLLVPAICFFRYANRWRTTHTAIDDGGELGMPSRPWSSDNSWSQSKKSCRDDADRSHLGAKAEAGTEGLQILRAENPDQIFPFVSACKRPDEH